MVIEIPDEIISQTNVSKQDLLIETACFIFKHGKISPGLAAKIAGMSKFDFYNELKKREINWMSDEIQLQEEFDVIKKQDIHGNN